MGTRKQKSTEKKRRLLDAAERVYYRDGDLGLTVRRLASEASTTSQTIYTYFGSRDAVIGGMYERVLADLDVLLDTIETVARQAPPALIDGRSRANVLPAAQVYRRHALAKPAQLRMLATARGPEGTDPTELIDRRNRLIAAVEQSSNPGGGAVIVAAVNGFVEAELNHLLAANGRSETLFAELIGSLTAGR